MAGDPRLHVKTTDLAGLPRLQAEAEGLAALRATASVRVPAVINIGVTEGNPRGNGDTAAWLEVEYLELCSLDRSGGAALGRQLAALHRHTAPRYGWATDNFIGLGPQVNGWMDSWPRFWAEKRLRPQLRLARANGLDRLTLDQGEHLAEMVAAFFVDTRHPAASLLHGDLWGGNAGQLPDGTPVIFDPACYYGDREADIAMSELFGGFPDSFQATYREAWPLDPGYETRKVLYNLYHVLNHFNLFGAGYLGQAKRMIAKLLAELKG